MIDSGASKHLCGNKSDFCELSEKPEGSITLADGNSILIQGKGSVPLQCFNGNIHKDLMAIDVLFVPGLEASLLSVSMLNNKGFNVTINANGQCNSPVEKRFMLQVSRKMVSTR